MLVELGLRHTLSRRGAVSNHFFDTALILPKMCVSACLDLQKCHSRIKPNFGDIISIFAKQFSQFFGEKFFRNTALRLSSTPFAFTLFFEISNETNVRKCASRLAKMPLGNKA